VKSFGVPVVVAINHFYSDTDAEIAAVKAYVAEQGAEAILCKHWAHGSAGIEDLAHKVVQLAEGGARTLHRSIPTRCRCSRRSRPSPSASTTPMR
jgi:formyltetrahydrofolate synthetase